MRQLDRPEGLVDELDEAFAAYQTLKPSPETGARWNLEQDAFVRWWGALVEDDRNEFMYVYSGDIVLARFVAAYDYLVSVEQMQTNGAPIVLAYAIAAGIDPATPEAKIRAAKAWQHDAVQGLLDRLRYRSIRQAGARITSAMTALIEKSLALALDSGDYKERAAALNSALQLLKITATEDIVERAERTKRGFVAARGALGPGTEEVEVTADQAALYIKALAAKLGPEVVRKALE